MAANTASPGFSGWHGDNARQLSRDAAWERATALLLAFPSLIVVGVFVVLPCLWLLYTSFFAVDGSFSLVNYERVASRTSYLNSYVTTFRLSFLTMVFCVAIGVPFAVIVSSATPRQATLFMVAILFPFWTSLLVRTYAWLVLLQRNGLVNSALTSIGVVDEPLPLAFNEFAAAVGMVHYMLPIFLLPTINAMREIDKDVIRAAVSLGASRHVTFFRVFLPLALPGIVAGAVLVFVMSIGFYVTPQLLGGGNVQVISMQIARSLATVSSWGAASALGIILLLATTLILVLGFALPRFLARKWRVRND